MPLQVRNAELVALLAGDLQARYEPQFAWKSAASLHQMLPGLRGFWPTSSVTEAGALVDLSGQSHGLTLNGNPLFRRYYLPPIVALDGTGDYFSDPGGVGSWCDITGGETYININVRGVTVGGWFYFGNAAGATEFMISKWDIGGAEKSYALWRTAAGAIQFGVSDDGANVQTVATTGTPAADEWFWAAGRYDDATEEIDVWYNTETVNQALAGWGGTLRSNTTDFLIGGRHGGSDLMTGYISQAFTCAASVPDSTLGQVFQQTRAMYGV